MQLGELRNPLELRESALPQVEDERRKAELDKQQLLNVGCIGGPNWILSTLYTPEESLGRPPLVGTTAALTYDLTLASLTTNPNIR
jgi:hypothetical protein